MTIWEEVLDSFPDEYQPIAEAVLEEVRRMWGSRLRLSRRKKKSDGTYRARPPAIPASELEFVRELWREGHSLTYICRALDNKGVPTVYGGKWAWPTVLRYVQGMERGEPIRDRVVKPKKPRPIKAKPRVEPAPSYPPGTSLSDRFRRVDPSLMPTKGGH